MWSPTHVHVVVQRAKGLITKGKSKTNDCFVTIALGKEKYQTSVKEKADENVEWHEECELQIPAQGNTAEIVLTALHRNFLGVDEFLGTVRIPLSSFDIYEMPKNRWYTLTSKPGKENTKDRGKLEVRVGFVVKAGSLSDLTKKEKHKRSLGQISLAAQSIGGSLLSIGSIEKRKGLKKFAKSIGNKVKGKSKSKSQLNDSFLEENEIRNSRERLSGQRRADADPGVVSDDEDDFTFDDLSHKSSTSSINSSTPSNWKLPENTLNKVQSNQSSIKTSSDISESVQIANSQHSPIPASRGSTPPSKPPRFALSSNNIINNESVEKQPVVNPEDEWGRKLYGLQSGNALKRWENKRNSPKIIIDEAKEESESRTVLEHNAPKYSPVISRSRDFINETPPVAAVRQMTLPREKEKMHNFEKTQKEAEKLAKKEKKKEKHNQHYNQKSSSERIIIGGEESTREENLNNNQVHRLPKELLAQFDGKSREDLIEMVLQLQLEVADKKKRLHDLEDYIDGLLLRVIESSPRLLQNPYQYSQRRLSSPGNQ